MHGSIDFIEEAASQPHIGEILNDVTDHASFDLRRRPPPSWSNVDRVGPVDSGKQNRADISSQNWGSSVDNCEVVDNLVVSVLSNEVSSVETSPSLVAVTPFDPFASKNLTAGVFVF